MKMRGFVLGVSVVVTGVLSAPAIGADAGIEFIGKASIPGTARDNSGLTMVLPGEVPHDRLGSFGSGIDYTGKDDLYIAVDDRGPGDGVAQFRCRMQTFRIVIAPGSDSPVSVELVGTTLLRDREWRPLVGWSGEIDAERVERSLRFDAEGVRVTARGTVLISDEYGPWIDEFSKDGIQVRRVVPPAKFVCAAPSKDPKGEMPPTAMRGRQANRGFEGLAITPDGSSAVAILQSPLIQDHSLDEKNKRVGENVRMLVQPLDGGATVEYVYTLENAKAGVNEIVGVSGTRFLVLERDGGAGKEAAHRGVYLIDTAGATDVSGVEELPRTSAELSRMSVPATPVKKRRVLDLMDASYGLAGPEMPEKIEGLAFGPRLTDGRRTLIVTTDNDMKAEQASWFWVFAVAESALTFDEPSGATREPGPAR